MRFNIERNLLLRALGHVYRVVERKNTIPILSNVHLSVADGSLRLRATDLDMEVTEAVLAEVQVPGATTVPAAMLHDIVKKLPEGGQVSFELGTAGNIAVIKSGRSRFSLSVLPETDFPDLAAGDMSNAFDIPAKTLAVLVEKSQFAISTDETRYYLNGIFLHVRQGQDGTVMRAVATDGHRLARVEIPAPEGSEGMPSVIVPKKAVTEIMKLVSDGIETVHVEVSPTKVRLTFGEVILISKLIDGTYPDYDRVIPTGNDKALLVGRDSLAKAVDRVATVASERGKAVKLSATQDKLTLTVENPDSGSATEEVEVDYASPALDIGFNAKYLLDIVGQIDGDMVRIMLADPRSPTLVQDPSDTAALFVLMPMNVN